MPEPSHENLPRAYSPRGEAFLDVLMRHSDHVVNYSDLEEYFPELDWTGRVSTTWKELERDEDLAPHLKAFGDGKSRVYAYVSNPDDFRLLLDRVNETASLLENSSADGVEAVTPKTIKRWKKLAAVVGAVGTVGAVGVTVYRKTHKS